jgi:hypothetical protein
MSQNIVATPLPLVAYPAFRDFPWQNGSVLYGPVIAEEVRRWYEDEPTQYPDIDHAILTVSASDCSRDIFV